MLFLTESVRPLTLCRCPLYLWSVSCVSCCWWSFWAWTWSEYMVAAASSTSTCPCPPYYLTSHRWRSWSHTRWSGRIRRATEVGSLAHHLWRHLQRQTIYNYASFLLKKVFLVLVTVSFEPGLQRFRHVKGKPFVFHLIVDEAGSEVSSRGAQTVVELYTLLIPDGSLLDQHPQLCTG